MKADNFYAGIICALAFIKSHGEETVFHDVVNSVDAKKLVEHAKKHGQMRWSGLSKYGYGRRQR